MYPSTKAYEPLNPLSLLALNVKSSLEINLKSYGNELTYGHTTLGVLEEAV